MSSYAIQSKNERPSPPSKTIRTPGGVAVLAEVASLEPGRTPAAITRIDRNRTMNVTADANKQQANLEAIKSDLEIFQETTRFYPTLSILLKEKHENKETPSIPDFWASWCLVRDLCLIGHPFPLLSTTTDCDDSDSLWSDWSRDWTLDNGSRFNNHEFDGDVGFNRSRR